MCDSLGNVEGLYTLNTDVEVERCFEYLDQEVRCPLWSCLVPVINVNSRYDYDCDSPISERFESDSLV